LLWSDLPQLAGKMSLASSKEDDLLVIDAYLQLKEKRATDRYSCGAKPPHNPDLNEADP